MLKKKKKQHKTDHGLRRDKGDIISSVPYLKVMLTISSKMSTAVMAVCQDVTMTTTQSLSLEASW